MNESFKDIQKRERSPISYEIFKGMTGKFGALRFKFIRPWTNNNPKYEKGSILVEMAPPCGRNQYDWENNKIIFSLTVTDIGKIIYYFSNLKAHEDNNGKSFTLRLLHDPKAGTKDKGKNFKNLQISKSIDMNNFFFKLSVIKDKKEVNSANVPVASDEAMAIKLLLEEAVPQMLAWTAIGREK